MRYSLWMIFVSAVACILANKSNSIVGVAGLIGVALYGAVIGWAIALATSKTILNLTFPSGCLAVFVGLQLQLGSTCWCSGKSAMLILQRWHYAACYAPLCLL